MKIILSFTIQSERERLSIMQIKNVLKQIHYICGPIPYVYKHRSKKGEIQLFFRDETFYKNFLDRLRIIPNNSFKTNIGIKDIILFEFKEIKYEK